MPSWTIRTATLHDLDGVLALWRAAEVHPATGSHRAGLERLLASDAEALLVAEPSAQGSVSDAGTGAGAGPGTDPGAGAGAGASASVGPGADPGSSRDAPGISPIGSLIAVWDGWRGSFYRLAVHPEHRRAGLAGELVREGERRLAARGAERLTAIVAEEDPGAHEFWAAAGYECQPGRERFVRELAR